ncbi:MAG: putative zinc-binding metallopeptidase [Chthoniobacter sp.]
MPQGEKEEFLSLLRDWAKLSPAINEIVASLGHPAFYPFVFSDTIIRKFFFVHHMVKFHGGNSTEATQPPNERRAGAGDGVGGRERRASFHLLSS